MKSSSVKLMRICAIAAGLVVAVAPAARAQAPEPDRIFLGVNAGAQIHSHTVASSDSFLLYDETARVISSTDVKGGFLFDVSGGYRLAPSFGVGIGLTSTGSSGSGSVVASLPDPLVFDSFEDVTISVDTLDHREVAVHVSAILFLPVPDALPDDVSIAFIVGPSVFNLSQELVSSVVIPTGTQNALPEITEESKTTVGFHAGFDLTYPVTQAAGVGAFLRYSGGSADLETAPGVKVGGFQIGAGLRLGF